MSVPLHHYAKRTSTHSPGATALVLGEERVTYHELVCESRQLARLLIEIGVEPGDRVALMVPKSPAAVIAMHAILEVGAAYVPVDLASPAPRAGLVLDSSEPSVVIAGPEAAALLDKLAGEGSLGEAKIVSIDPEWSGGETALALHGPADWSDLPDGELPVREAPGDLAHILFTSGSTGVPKGVQITHSMVVAFVEWAVSHFGTAPNDRISGHPPLHFDLSTFDIYATLAAGAELHLVPTKASMLPGTLATFIRESELTQWFSVPSTLAFMARAGVIEQDDFPTVKRVLFCGEAMPTPVLADWMRLVPHASYCNLYGPTEATIASSYYDVRGVPSDETAPLPIGVPCPGEELLVLDGDLQPAGPEEVGELFIAGVGLSPGYWRDEEKTRAAFLDDPRGGGRIYRTGDLGSVDRDGLFMYAGRTDSQIKHRGYRIELGEIESALSALDKLGESAVVAVETGGFEATTICCAYVARDPGEIAPTELRASLADSIPTYMMPSRWRQLDSLPKNANGKIDRRALREGFESETN